MVSLRVNVKLSSISANKCSLYTIIKMKKSNHIVVSIYQGNIKFLDPTHHQVGSKNCKQFEQNIVMTIGIEILQKGSR